MILVIELLMLVELAKVRAHVKYCICGFDIQSFPDVNVAGLKHNLELHPQAS